MFNRLSSTQSDNNFADSESWLQLLKANKAIAVIRCSEMKIAHGMAHAVAAGGMNLLEITWNSDRPEELLGKLRAELPHCTIGVGTILNIVQLEQAITAGAEFAFTPHFNRELLETSILRYQIPLVPGAFSPTEIVNAWQSGAKVIKVFPIKSLGGAEYIRCLQGPLSQIHLIPTGGITLENAKNMLDAGAIAVGISSSLFPKQSIANQDWSNITARAKTLIQRLT